MAGARRGSNQTPSSEAERVAQVYERYRTAGAANRWSQANPGNRLLLAERRERTATLLHGYWGSLADLQVLEAGCGYGSELAALVAYGADPRRLHGVDVLTDRVAAAKRTHPEISFAIADAQYISARGESFNIVLAITLFSSILDVRVRSNAAREIDRVLAPGGTVLWYDMRRDNPWNPYVRGLNRREIGQLFPGYRGSLEPITLLPPLLRRTGRLTSIAYAVLRRFDPLHTHLIGLLVKPRPGDGPTGVL